MEKKSAESLSSLLTPNEIKNHEFKRTAWGYSPKEVIEYLDKTAKTWERVQKNEKELLTKIENLQGEIKDWQQREGQIGKIQERALRDAEQIREEAIKQGEKVLEEIEKKANEIRIQTEGWLESVIAEVEETQRQKENFILALRSSLDSHYSLIEKEKAADTLGKNLAKFCRVSRQNLS